MLVESHLYFHKLVKHSNYLMAPSVILREKLAYCEFIRC